jgi:hypothetical protein
VCCVKSGCSRNNGCTARSGPAVPASVPHRTADPLTSGIEGSYPGFVPLRNTNAEVAIWRALMAARRRWV